MKVYMQYYYHYLISASQRRECRRPLDIASLAYLTAVAAFGTSFVVTINSGTNLCNHVGFARGSTEFDKAFGNRDIEYINNLIIDRESFLKFFWDQSDDNFSFIHCWRLIDRVCTARSMLLTIETNTTAAMGCMGHTRPSTHSRLCEQQSLREDVEGTHRCDWCLLVALQQQRRSGGGLRARGQDQKDALEVR